MSPLNKIKNTLQGVVTLLTDQEQAVVDMACHLEAMHIAAMPSVEERRAAVSALPKNLADAVKAEIIQEFARRKPTNGT